MIEGQNKIQSGVLTLEGAALCRPNRFLRVKSGHYPQTWGHTCSSSVADPSLSPRLRGQRHGTCVWRVAGKEREVGVVVRVVNVERRRKGRIAKGDETKRANKPMRERNFGLLISELEAYDGRS